MFKVSASHPNPKWQLSAEPFANVDAGEWGDYRVKHDKALGWYAIAPNFGCGRNASTPERAITSLLAANGCTAILVEAGQ